MFMTALIFSVNRLTTEPVEGVQECNNLGNRRDPFSADPLLLWWSGVVVSTLALINEVNLRRTWLVLRWVTVSGSIPGAGHLFHYVTNQPPKANSAFHPSGVDK